MTKRIEGMQDPKLEWSADLQHYAEAYPDWPHIRRLRMDVLEQLVEVREVETTDE